MSFISKIFYALTPYTNARERAVELFFKSLNEHSNQSQTQARVGNLLQRNIAVINLWTEYRYKGYKYLAKSERKKLYTNLQLIEVDFGQFYMSHARTAEAVVEHIHRLAPQAVVDPNKAVFV